MRSPSGMFMISVYVHPVLTALITQTWVLTVSSTLAVKASSCSSVAIPEGGTKNPMMPETT